MEHALLKLMHETEDSWWYRGRISIVRAVLRRARIGRLGTALDIGAGYGGMLSFLKNYADSVDAYEPDSEAMIELSRRGYRRVYTDVAQALAEKHNIIGLFDVLEHIENDEDMLIRLHDTLVEDGALILTVPAYRWLWSIHDERNQHFRRYSARELRRKLVESGFEIRFVSYWNTVLSPVAVLARLGGIAGESGLSSGNLINAILLQFIRLEALIIRIASLPFGLSLVAVAVRKK